MVGLQEIERFAIDARDGAAKTFAIFFGEVRDERRNIFAAFAQRWNVNRKNVETIVEVAAKAAGADFFGKIAIGGGDEADVYLHGVGAAEALEFALLQDAQQQNLHFLGQFTDFVEKKRAAVRLLEAAFAAFGSAAECAALVAEKFGGEQRVWNGSAIYFDERAAGAFGAAVDRAGDQFFAGACFAGDEDGGVGSGDLLDDFERVFELGGIGEDFFEPWSLAELFAQRNIFGFELLAELADFFVGKRVGGGDGEGAGNIFEDGFFVGREVALLEADECGDAEDLAAHDKRNGGVRPNTIFRQVIFVAEPCVFFEEIVASVRFAGNVVVLVLFRVWKKGACFRERRRMRIAFGTCGELLGRFALDRGYTDNVERE